MHCFFSKMNKISVGFEITQAGLVLPLNKIYTFNPGEYEVPTDQLYTQS